MKRVILVICSLFAFIVAISADDIVNDGIGRSVSAENVEHFYVDVESEHKYCLGVSRDIESAGYEDYSVKFYVDTAEVSLAKGRDEYCVFARMEFYRGNKKITYFDNDDWWTCVGVKDGKPVMFKEHRVGESLALIFQGFFRPDDIPLLSIFMLHEDQVTLVYNKINYIEENETLVDGDMTMYKCLTELGEIEPKKDPQYSTLVIDSNSIFVIPPSSRPRYIYRCPK